LVFGVVGIFIIKSFAAPNPKLSGDLNNDNVVSGADLSILAANYKTANAVADVNSDNTVDIADLSIVLSHYGQTVALSIPNLPTGLAAAPGDGSVSLSWNSNAASDQVDVYQGYLNGNNGTGTAPTHIGFRNNQWNINAAGSDDEEYTRHAFAGWNFGGHFANDENYGGKDYRKIADWVGGNHTVVKDEWVHFRIGMHFDYTNNNGTGNGWYEAWARWGNMTSWVNIVPRVSNIPLGTSDVDGNGHTIYPMLSSYYDVGNGGTLGLDYADGAFSNDYQTLANWQDARLGF
jgi:hypothetical protein